MKDEERRCDWQVEYGTAKPYEVLCGEPAEPGYPWCADHINDAGVNYPRLPIPRL